MNFPGPHAGEQQAFHHQVPVPNGHSTALDQQFAHSRQQSYPIPNNSGTPLSNIPERAIHAQPFQPYQSPGYGSATYNGQPAFYYPGGNPATGQYAPGAVIAPMYLQNPQAGGYIVPTVAAPAPPAMVPPPPPVGVQGSQANSGTSGMVAHEQNGMVYYYDPTQMYVPPEGYSQPNYPMGGMGSMMPPAPDGYYYPQVPPGHVYYPQQ